MRVTRGDLMSLLPAGGSSRRVGKFGYGRRVEMQRNNRRAVLVTCQHSTTDRPAPVLGNFEVFRDL